MTYSEQSSSRRLAAIMFIDIAGYTALGQRNESQSLALVEQQRQIIHPILGRHNGREVKTMGDGLLAEFPSALHAVRCAYNIQKAAREFNISLHDDDEKLGLRIGVHLGDVIEASDGDILGDAVNVASRIEPLAEEGGVCISQQVYDHVHNKFELPLESIGRRPLKHVSAPMEVYRVVMPWERQEAQTIGRNDGRRIAVLPFRNMSPDPNDEYFAEGMTEELITSLSKIKELTVIARTSVMQYKNVSKKVSEIARELNAGALIEGSVRKAGNKVRVAVQLIDPGSEGHIWAENYDRELLDIFALQSEIAANTAETLRVKLLSSEVRELEKKPTKNSEAYTLYLKGRRYLGLATNEDLVKAIRYFELATEEDREFAEAYAAMSECYVYLSGQTIPNETGFPKAKEFAFKALELDENIPSAHTCLGIIAMQYDFDWKACEKRFRRAIELNPSYALAHQWYGEFLGNVKGEIDGAIVEVRKAEDLDPLSAFIKWFLGGEYLRARMYDQVKIKCQEALNLNPGQEYAYLYLGRAFAQTGEIEEAVEAFNKANVLGQGLPYTLASVGYGLALQGRRGEAERVIENLEKSEIRVYPVELAVIYTALGEREKALDCIERGYQTKDPSLMFLNGMPMLDSIRSEPRYVSVRRKMGIA